MVDLRWRCASLEDAGKVAALRNACSLAEIGVETEVAAWIHGAWQTPGFDPARDVLVAELADGSLAGCGVLWDVSETHVRMYSNGCVHPAWMGKGIGTRILDWMEERARENSLSGGAPDGARVVLVNDIRLENQNGARLLNQRGFECVRARYEMRIELDGVQAETEPIELPAGLSLRPWTVLEEKAAIHALDEALKDHWGHVEEPFEQVYERFHQWMQIDPSLAPELRLVAMDGDEIAAAALCSAFLPNEMETGWVNEFGVRRAWRKRGLGLAMLRFIFAKFKQRGARQVGLSVDASSLTGAVRLYERAGMHVARETHVYEKELRAGKELSTMQAGI